MTSFDNQHKKKTRSRSSLWRHLHHWLFWEPLSHYVDSNRAEESWNYESLTDSLLPSSMLEAVPRWWVSLQGGFETQKLGSAFSWRVCCVNHQWTLMDGENTKTNKTLHTAEWLFVSAQCLCYHVEDWMFVFQFMKHKHIE